MGRLVVVTGTGTEIGKTHVCEALLAQLGAGSRRVAAVKPVESGVAPGVLTDAERLARASTFHVKHRGVQLAEPISPHRAARRAGVTLDVDALAAAVLPWRADVDVLVVELPGGLFTPLSDGAVNADLALRLRPDALLLVAPDRLGVLHDVIASLRAATAMGLTVTAVLLVAPDNPDASTGTNREELSRVTSAAILPTVRRAPAAALASDDAIAAACRAVAP
jgi:dethiobiotin synthetase